MESDLEHKIDYGSMILTQTQQAEADDKQEIDWGSD